MARIDELLTRMSEGAGSDLFIMAGERPKFKVDGEIAAVDDWPELTAAETRDLLFEITTEKQRSRFTENLDFDFAYGLGKIGRFRCNYYHNRTGYAAVMRIIPTQIMTIQELNLPSVLVKFCGMRGGLILVTGPTGSGKTTSLAAMINHINDHYSRRIITIEDPVEFVHPNKSCLISHREVGTHTRSFADALRGVSRQDADVVLVGEMRDLETVSLALSAAAMGTLVFGTLHTNSAAKTIDRIIDVFPSDQQNQARSALGESLRGVVAQQLMKKIGGGRVALNEILMGNQAVASTIREGNTPRINSIIQSGGSEGMQLMDNALEHFVEKGTIRGEDAYMKCNEKGRFAKYVEKNDE